MEGQSKQFYYMRKPEVIKVTGMSGSSLYRLEKQKKFPRRFQISNNIVAWRSDQIFEWMSSCNMVGG